YLLIVRPYCLSIWPISRATFMTKHSDLMVRERAVRNRTGTWSARAHAVDSGPAIMDPNNFRSADDEKDTRRMRYGPRQCADGAGRERARRGNTGPSRRPASERPTTRSERRRLHAARQRPGCDIS